MGFDYDLVVIGGGSAGLTAARFANRLGKRVALVESAGRTGAIVPGRGACPASRGNDAAHVVNRPGGD